MIKIKDMSTAMKGDFIYYDHKLSIISSVDKLDGRIIMKLEDGTELKDDSVTKFEMFRTQTSF